MFCEGNKILRTLKCKGLAPDLPEDLYHLIKSAAAIRQRRQWQPTPVLLPGKSHGQRSLVGCSPWGPKELDMPEQLHFHFSLSYIGEGNGNPLPCSCLENPRDAEPGRLPSMGSHRVGHDWSDLAAAAAAAIQKHLEKNRKDKDAKFHLTLIESHIHIIIPKESSSLIGNTSQHSLCPGCINLSIVLKP